MADEEAPAVGIDLGTSFSCVTVFQDDRVKVIANETGYRITASYVSFTPDGHIVGDDAKYRLTLHPKDTVYEVKRLIGRSFDEPSVAKDIQLWPFEVFNENNKPKIAVYPKGDDNRQTYTPEEISAKVLQKMKAVAEAYLGKTVKRAVITVPAYFNMNQREATKRAAQIAGLDVLRIINEPEAAAMAFSLHNRSQSERNILVFDLGGGTFDVSVLTQDNGIIEVRAKCGDTNLGGSDFDSRVAENCLEWFNEKCSPRHPIAKHHTSRPFHRLRRACEYAKCNLSYEERSVIRVEQFQDEKNFYKTITREEFDELNKDYFNKTLDIVKQTLQDAKLTRQDIDEVLLVGGSTRIPKIQEMLQRFFGGKRLNKTINPDEAVAYGAAIQAAILDGESSKNLHDIQLMDITPLSLGVKIKGGIQSTIIKRNTLIPYKNTKTYVTCEDDQTTIYFGVYQGEREFVKDNQFLGGFTVDNIPPAPAGVVKVDVTFELDTDGILDVIAVIEQTGEEVYQTIKNATGGLSNAEVERMVREAAKSEAEDKKERDRILARNDLESYTHWISVMLKDCPASIRAVLGVSQLDKLKVATSEMLTWLNGSQNATKAEYEYKKERIVARCSKLPQKYKIPGQLPEELQGKYSMDHISTAAYHTINPDLD